MRYRSRRWSVALSDVEVGQVRVSGRWYVGSLLFLPEKSHVGYRVTSTYLVEQRL